MSEISSMSMIKEKATKKYRVLFLIDYIIGIAGTENQIIKLVNHLDKKKYDIYLVCLSHSD